MDKKKKKKSENNNVIGGPKKDSEWKEVLKKAENTLKLLSKKVGTVAKELEHGAEIGAKISKLKVEEISLEIAGICLENKIEDKKMIEEVASRVTLALFDQIPKESLTKILEKGVGLSHEKAEKISAAVKESIFSQLSGLRDKKDPSTELEIESRRKKRDTYREPPE